MMQSDSNVPKVGLTAAAAPSYKINDLNLNNLIHLALSSSPKVGVVNFNLLKVFLLELLKALKLQNYEIQLSDDGTDSIETKKLLEDDFFNFNNQQNLLSESGAAMSANTRTANILTSGLLTPDLKPITYERFRTLEDKMHRFEQQINVLNSLPSNQQIIEKSKDLSKSNNNPILEVWQYTQLSKRLESNEDGLTKLTSLLQDLINDMNEIKESQLKNTADIKRLDELFNDLVERFSSLEKLKESMPSINDLRNLENELEALKRNLANLDLFDEKLKFLTDQIKTIENKIYEFVTHPDLELYVTWPGLENCLKGLRDAIDSVNTKQKEFETEKHSILPPLTKPISPPPTVLPPVSAVAPVSINSEQRYTQTTPVSPVVLKPTPEPRVIKETVFVSRPPSSSSQPTRDLQEILSKLGTLNERHEKLRELVEKLKSELDTKLDRSQIPPTPAQAEETPQVAAISFKLPDDFPQKIEEIRKIISTLEELKNNIGIETSKRIELEKMIANLTNDLDNIREKLKECLRNTQLNKNEIFDLKEALKLLDETKADKEWVKSEFERKADKRDLDIKLNKKTFDESINDVSNSINTCIQKNSCLEDEMKKGNEKIFRELENKLDRLELSSLKDYIEKQLRRLKKLQKENLQQQTITTLNPEDEAAGLRKPLLRFHCLSCDRPIEMAPQHIALPSLPAEKGIRPIQTPRPYQTFELDQIRQFQKQQLIQDSGYDLFSTVRQCGGPHTLTVPQKKVHKVLPDETGVNSSTTHTTHKNEVQLQGQDGHIYKGRIDARLSIEMKKQIKNSNTYHKVNSSSSINNTNVNFANNSSNKSASNMPNINNPNPSSLSYTNIRLTNETETEEQDDQSIVKKQPVISN